MIEKPNIVSGETSQSVTKSKKILPAIIILVLLALAGGTAAYTYYSGSFITLPKLLSEWMKNAKDNKTASYDFELTADLSEIEDIAKQAPLGVDLTRISADFKGSLDFSDINKLKGSMSVSVFLGSVHSLGIEMIFLNDFAYIKLSKIPEIPILPADMLSPYQNKWFSLPNNSLVLTSEEEFTDEEVERMNEILKEHHFLIKSIKRLDSEAEGGEDSYHFSFELDRLAVIPFLESLEKYEESIGKISKKFSFAEVDSADFNEAFNEAFDKLKDFKGEIWIGKKDRLLHKVSADFGIVADPTKDEQIKMNVALTLSDYNKPLSITAPSDSIPLENFISSLMSESLGAGAKTKSKK